MTKGKKIVIISCTIILALLIIALLLIVFIMPDNKKEQNKKEEAKIEADNVVEYVEKKYETKVEKEIIPAKNIIDDEKKKAIIYQVKAGVNEFPDYIKPKDVIIDKYENFILVYKDEERFLKDYEALKKDEHTLFVEELKLDDVGMSDKENEEETIENLSYISELMNVNGTVQKIKESNSSRKIAVGIIDTGLYSENSEIVRYVNTEESYDYVNADDNVFDKMDNHATMVISSYLEVVGHDIAKNNIDIISGKALENGMGSYYDIYLAIMGMADKCDIINMSFGSSINNSMIESAINYAAGKNCIMVCAAGNDGGNVSFPARNSKVIAVSANDYSIY